MYKYPVFIMTPPTMTRHYQAKIDIMTTPLYFDKMIDEASSLRPEDLISPENIILIADKPYNLSYDTIPIDPVEYPFDTEIIGEKVFKRGLRLQVTSKGLFLKDDYGTYRKMRDSEKDYLMVSEWAKVSIRKGTDQDPYPLHRIKLEKNELDFMSETLENRIPVDPILSETGVESDRSSGTGSGSDKKRKKRNRKKKIPPKNPSLKDGEEIQEYPLPTSEEDDKRRLSNENLGNLPVGVSARDGRRKSNRSLNENNELMVTKIGGPKDTLLTDNNEGVELPPPIIPLTSNKEIHPQYTNKNIHMQNSENIEGQSVEQMLANILSRLGKLESIDSNLSRIEKETSDQKRELGEFREDLRSLYETTMRNQKVLYRFMRMVDKELPDSSKNPPKMNESGAKSELPKYKRTVKMFENDEREFEDFPGNLSSRFSFGDALASTYTDRRSFITRELDGEYCEIPSNNNTPEKENLENTQNIHDRTIRSGTVTSMTFSNSNYRNENSNKPTYQKGPAPMVKNCVGSDEHEETSETGDEEVRNNERENIPQRDDPRDPSRENNRNSQQNVNSQNRAHMSENRRQERRRVTFEDNNQRYDAPQSSENNNLPNRNNRNRNNYESSSSENRSEQSENRQSHNYDNHNRSDIDPRSSRSNPTQRNLNPTNNSAPAYRSDQNRREENYRDDDSQNRSEIVHRAPRRNPPYRDPGDPNDPPNGGGRGDRDDRRNDRRRDPPRRNRRDDDDDYYRSFERDDQNESRNDSRRNRSLSDRSIVFGQKSIQKLHERSINILPYKGPEDDRRSPLYFLEQFESQILNKADDDIIAGDIFYDIIGRSEWCAPWKEKLDIMMGYERMSKIFLKMEWTVEVQDLFYQQFKSENKDNTEFTNFGDFYKYWRTKLKGIRFEDSYFIEHFVHIMPTRIQGRVDIKKFESLEDLDDFIDELTISELDWSEMYRHEGIQSRKKAIERMKQKAKSSSYVPKNTGTSASPIESRGNLKF